MVENALDKMLYAVLVGGGDGPGCAKSQQMKLRRRGSRVATVGFVDHKMKPFAEAPQALGDSLVGGCKTVSRIHQEQNGIGFLDSDQGLPGDKGFDAFLVTAQSTRVHYEAWSISQEGASVLTVSRQTGLICDQRVS